MSFKRVKIEKLIRDRLPELLQNQGILVNKRVMKQNEFITRLKDKLQEEADEVKCSTTLDELTEELADLLEVFYTLVEATGITLDQIEKKRIQKRQEKGGFDQKIYASHYET